MANDSQTNSQVKIKRTLGSLLLAFCLLGADLAGAVDYGEPDKQKHVMASFGIASISYGAARAARFGRVSSVLMSSLLTIGIGYLKESTDPKFDHRDMQANYSGAAMGLILPLSFSF